MLAVHYNNLPFVLHYNFTHLVIAGTVVEHKVLTPGKKETETQWLTEPLLMADRSELLVKSHDNWSRFFAVWPPLPLTIIIGSSYASAQTHSEGKTWKPWKSSWQLMVVRCWAPVLSISIP